MLQLAAHFCENDAPWKVTAVDQLKAVQVVATTIATNSCMHATIVATTIAATTTMARSFSCRMQCRCNSSSAILLATACGTYSTVGRLTHSPQTLLCAVCCLLPLLPLLVFFYCFRSRCFICLPVLWLAAVVVIEVGRRRRIRHIVPVRSNSIAFVIQNISVILMRPVHEKIIPQLADNQQPIAHCVLRKMLLCAYH